jgi:hypothetical protein
MAGLLDDLHANLDQFRAGQRHSAIVGTLTAVVRLVGGYRACVATPEIAAQLGDLRLCLAMQAEILEAMSPADVKRLERSAVLRRQRRALVAASVESLFRRGWKLDPAGEFVSRIVGGSTATARSARNAVVREQRRLGATTFEALEARTAAEIHAARVPTTKAEAAADARRVVEVLRRRRQDLAVYQAAVDMWAGCAEDVLPGRIAETLAVFGVARAKR